MKIKISKSQWEAVGLKSGWLNKKGQITETEQPIEEPVAQTVANAIGFGTGDKVYPDYDEFELGGNYPAFVTAYFVDRTYGGPEEGGWWYNYYGKVESILVTSPEEAKAKVVELFAKHKDQYNDDEHDLSSVLSNGKLEVVTEMEEGEFQTKEKPHYE